MSTITITVMHCDRCKTSVEKRTALDVQGWSKIAVGSSPAIGIESEAHICDQCTTALTDWWLRKAEFPPVETKIVSRVRAALGLDDINLIKEQVASLLSTNIASAFSLLGDDAPPLPVGAIKEDAAQLVDEIVERHGLAKDGEA
jgi:hypothetical protein